MSKITVTGQLTLTGGQLTAKETAAAPAGPSGYTLWAWGYNSTEFPLLGDGTIIAKSSPVQVGALTDWASINSAQGHSLGLKTDGTLWAWGKNDLGGLGLGNLTYYSSPVQVGSLTDWASIATGRLNSFAIKTNGSLWAWGHGNDGKLGNGSTNDVSSPVQVGALSDWASVEGGSDHTHAIKTNGTLWSWGAGNAGKLGVGNTIAINTSPIQVGNLTDWASVSALGSHSIALKTNGTIWAWGKNNRGQLGLGGIIYRSSPVQIGNLTTWASVSGGDNHTVAIKSNGTMWSWGQNNQGRLGIGDVANRSSPVQIGGLSDWVIAGAGRHSSGRHNHAIKTDGTLWAWGHGSFGKHGLGDTADRSSPVQIGSDTTWSSVSAGSYHSLALKT